MASSNVRDYFDDFHRYRKVNIQLIDSVVPSAIMIIPEKFRNNIYWQAGHLVAVQASLLYLRTNQPVPIEEKYFTYFGKGSSPAVFDSNIPDFSEIRRFWKNFRKLLCLIWKK